MTKQPEPLIKSRIPAVLFKFCFYQPISVIILIMNNALEIHIIG